MPIESEKKDRVLTLNVENYIVNIGAILNNDFFKKKLQVWDGDEKNLIYSVSIKDGFVDTKNPGIFNTTLWVGDLYGIILAKNDQAKKLGVKTGEVIWQGAVEMSGCNLFATKLQPL